MRKIDNGTLEQYFYNQYLLDGKYDLPMVAKQHIDLAELKLIRFSSIIKNETKDLDATVHFFEYDNRFDEVWKTPGSYIDELKQYKQLMTPDFSIYTNMSRALQIFNTYRTRWLGAYWQENGLVVIPTVSWSDEWSFDFCFDGIEKSSVVAVSTMGCMDVKKQFLEGFLKMCEVIEPSNVICYAKPFHEMRELSDIIEVPYLRNERIANAIIEDIQ
jgi:hypothetical protein